MPERPTPPDVPQYVLDALERQDPERLETIANYAERLAAYKRQQREHAIEDHRESDEIDDDARQDLDARDVSTDPADYEDVPPNAYITIKETKPEYRYYYWQWREGDSWKNQYIAPVNPGE